MIDTTDKPETVTQKLNETFIEVYETEHRPKGHSQLCGDWINVLLMNIDIIKIPYTNGCEVPPNSNRKWYYQVKINAHAAQHLYHTYLLAKFNASYFQLVYLDRTMLRHKFLSEATLVMLMDNINDDLNQHLKDTRAQVLTGVGEVLYNRFAQLDSELFEFDLKRKRFEEERLLKDLKIKKDDEPLFAHKSWWKFWK